MCIWKQKVAINLSWKIGLTLKAFGCHGICHDKFICMLFWVHIGIVCQCWIILWHRMASYGQYVWHTLIIIQISVICSFSDYHIAIEFHLVSMWDPNGKPSWQPTDRVAPPRRCGARPLISSWRTKRKRYLGQQILADRVPSGKHTKSYGKSPCLMGKSTISMVIFNSYVSHYQRV